MRSVARTYNATPSVIALSGAMVLAAADITAGLGTPIIAAGLVLAVVCAIFLARVFASWTRLTTGMLLVVLLIPSDERYTLPGNLPFQLELYRVVVGMLLVWWLIALLIDPRVRMRATRFEGPLLVIIIATLGSEIANPGRVSGISTTVIKSIWLFMCFALFMYMMVSVIRTRAVVELLVQVLVLAGSVVGLGAVLQRKTGFNVFNHLHMVLPFLKYTSALAPGALNRGGDVRATGSAGHPIELSADMTMLIPLAVYLAISRRQYRWWIAVVILLLGSFAGGSRTGVTSLLIILVVFLWLRPREVLRAWPAVIPLMLVLHVASPGSIGSVEAGFFPQGGLVAQQSTTFAGAGGKVVYTTRLSRWGPALHEFGEHNPLFGEGYGTRITGRALVADNAQILDDQWLGTLLETGALGIIGWAWLFILVCRRLGKRAKLERGTPQGWLPVALAASVAAFPISMFTYDAFSFTQATFIAFTMIGLSAILLWLPPVVASNEAPTSLGRKRLRTSRRLHTVPRRKVHEERAFAEMPLDDGDFDFRLTSRNLAPEEPAPGSRLEVKDSASTETTAESHPVGSGTAGTPSADPDGLDVPNHSLRQLVRVTTAPGAVTTRCTEIMSNPDAILPPATRQVHWFQPQSQERFQPQSHEWPRPTSKSKREASPLEKVLEGGYGAALASLGGVAAAIAVLRRRR